MPPTRKIQELIESGEGLPPEVNLKDRFIYYVGPVDPVGDEVMGPAGADHRHPHGQVHGFHSRTHGAHGHDRQGGARPDRHRGNKKAPGHLPDSRRRRRLLGGRRPSPGRGWRPFPELGMEAIYEFEVDAMPVTVAVDVNGESVHETGPAYWKAKIEEQAIEIV